jgi:hypothetical protein
MGSEMLKRRPSRQIRQIAGLIAALALASGCRQEAAQPVESPVGQAQHALASAAGENQPVDDPILKSEPVTTTALTPPQLTLIDRLPAGQAEDRGVSTGPTDESTVVVQPSSTPMPTRPPEPTPFPVTLNGLPLDAIIYMPDNVKTNVERVFARGQELGRNPRAFSKIGDSTIEKLNFFAKFDVGGYRLGDFAFLQPAIDYYAGSFDREGFAVVRGLHSWSVFDPIWANKTDCQPDETVIACEFRWHNPSVVLIRLGSNDQATDLFAESLRRIVEYSIENGVVPILATKPDRYEGESNENNLSIRQIAAEYEVPLWDFDLASGTLPDNGLSDDNVHMTTFYSYDYTRPEAFERGHAIQNLTALLALYMMWLQLAQA